LAIEKILEDFAVNQEPSRRVHHNRIADSLGRVHKAEKKECWLGEANVQQGSKTPKNSLMLVKQSLSREEGCLGIIPPKGFGYPSNSG
jgi:hypothetical protein